MSVGCDVKWCSVARISTLSVRKRPFQWIFYEDKRREGRQGNFKTSQLIKSCHLIVVAVKWLKYCRYGAKQSINQPMYRLVNYTINSPSVDNFFGFMKSQVNANELIT